MKKTLWIVCFCFGLTMFATAREAKTFTINPSGAVQIDPQSDHYSVIFEGGWISQNDNLFKKLFSKATKLTAETDGQSTFFDGDQVKSARIFNNTDIGHNLNRSWGEAI